MSDYEADTFIFQEFSSEEVDAENLSPGVDTDQSAFEENFDTDKNSKEILGFETQFTTKTDIKTLLENAKKEAGELIENAKKEVARIEKEAYGKGYDDGKEKGHRETREEGVQKLLPCIDAFEKSLKEIAACRALTYKNCEAELVELFNTLSQRVIHRELGRSNEFILDVIREAMKELVQQEKITIRLNPEDSDYAEGFKPELIKETGKIKNIFIEKDVSITKGGCVIESNFGEINSQVESKIHEIEKAVLEKKHKKEAYKTPEEPGSDEEPETSNIEH